MASSAAADHRAGRQPARDLRAPGWVRTGPPRGPPRRGTSCAITWVMRSSVSASRPLATESSTAVGRHERGDAAHRLAHVLRGHRHDDQVGRGGQLGRFVADPQRVGKGHPRQMRFVLTSASAAAGHSPRRVPAAAPARAAPAAGPAWCPTSPHPPRPWSAPALGARPSPGHGLGRHLAGHVDQRPPAPLPAEPGLRGAAVLPGGAVLPLASTAFLPRARAWAALLGRRRGSSRTRDALPEDEPDGRAAEPEGIADLVLEVALVAEVDVLGLAAEEHEGGRLGGRLRGVVEARPLALHRRRRLAVGGVGQHPVELRGGYPAPAAARDVDGGVQSTARRAGRSWR